MTLSGPMQTAWGAGWPADALAFGCSLNVCLAHALPVPRALVPSPPSPNDTRPAAPSYADIMDVRATLARAGRIPPHVVDQILDDAEYWQRSTSVLAPASPVVVDGHAHRHPDENRFLLRTPPLGFVDEASSDTSDAGHAYSHAPLPARSPTSMADVDTIRAWLPVHTRLQHPCRKIVFSLVSHDQGWGGGPGSWGTYDQSQSWFDVGRERYGVVGDALHATAGPSAAVGRANAIPGDMGLVTVDPESVAVPVEGGLGHEYVHLPRPSEHRLQSNRVGHPEPTRHEIVWRWTDEAAAPGAIDTLESHGRGRATGSGAFVRSLQLGDVVTVWAKARSPGWQNNVVSLRVEMFWGT